MTSGEGKVEVDANDNPLATLLYGPLNDVADGAIVPGEEPGLGVVPELDALESHRRAY